MRNKVVSLLFCLLLAVGAGSHLLTGDRFFSEHERRSLQQAPKLSWAGFSSGKFGREMEDYLADQFPGRDGWVSLKTLCERLSGRQESGGVYFGKEGYLIEKHGAVNQEKLESNLQALLSLAQLLESRDIPFSVLLVPTASAVLENRLPDFAPRENQEAVIQAGIALGLPMMDVSAVLLAHQEEYIYYKTDHHWTSLGAFYAYEAWRLGRGKETAPLSAWKREFLSQNFRGTTYTKINDPLAPYDSIEAFYLDSHHDVYYNGGHSRSDSLYERRYLEGMDQYGVFLNSNQADTQIMGRGEGRLLILKDSYANCFAQFCAEDYEETHLIDLRFYKGSITDYVEEKGITEVLVLYNIPNFTQDDNLRRFLIGEEKPTWG